MSKPRRGSADSSEEETNRGGQEDSGTVPKPQRLEIPLGKINPGDSPAPPPVARDNLRHDARGYLRRNRPLVVRLRLDRTDRAYDVVSGRLHWETARLLGLSATDCTVVVLGRHEVRRLRWLEWLQNFDKCTLRFGRSAQRFLDRTGWNQSDLVKCLPVSKGTLSEALKMARELSPRTVRAAADSAGISPARLTTLPRNVLRSIVNDEDPASRLDRAAEAIGRGEPPSDEPEHDPDQAGSAAVELNDGAVRVSVLAVRSMSPLKVAGLAAVTTWTLLRLRAESSRLFARVRQANS